MVYRMRCVSYTRPVIHRWVAHQVLYTTHIPFCVYYMTCSRFKWMPIPISFTNLRNRWSLDDNWWEPPTHMRLLLDLNLAPGMMSQNSFKIRPIREWFTQKKVGHSQPWQNSTRAIPYSSRITIQGIWHKYTMFSKSMYCARYPKPKHIIMFEILM